MEATNAAARRAAAAASIRAWRATAAGRAHLYRQRLLAKARTRARKRLEEAFPQEYAAFLELEVAALEPELRKAEAIQRQVSRRGPYGRYTTDAGTRRPG